MPAKTRRRQKEMPLSDQIDYEPEFNGPHIPVHLSSPSKENNKQDDNNSLKGDYTNIAILIFLYILQGIPLGLSGSIPLILSDRKVSYKEQAMFSFVFWPFSVKLLWAPIVDAAFIPSFGRRKTWLVPVQYLIGIFMFVMSWHITELLGDDTESGRVNVFVLTSVFFMLYFLAATQDIAVDGWALTMLSRKNVGWASTCNTVGQTVGYALSNIVFLALESPDFCNQYLRSTPEKYGMLTFSGFLYFWGIVFMVCTTLVWIFKHEDKDEEEEGGVCSSSILDTYKQLLSVLRLPSVLKYIPVLLTCKMGFAAADSISGLKLIEKGVPKEKLAILGVFMVPIQVILPLVISKYTAGPRPMAMFLKAMGYRLLLGIWFAVIVWWTPVIPSGDYPVSYYALLVFSYGLHQITLFTMFVSIMGFNAKISDPKIGGTYMTLMNSITNLGGNWPGTVALYFMDILTWSECKGTGETCGNPSLRKVCSDAGGTCSISIDGYYIESVVCVIIGVIWLISQKRKINVLQDLPNSAWSLNLKTNSK